MREFVFIFYLLKDLLGNPCAEEEDYREIVISRLSVLDIFDRHGMVLSYSRSKSLTFNTLYLVVTTKERLAADRKLKVAPQLFRSPSSI